MMNPLSFSSNLGRPNRFFHGKHTCALWGHLLSGRSPFFPSYAHLPPLRMTGAHVFSNAHDIAISGSTFYTADTVSGTVRYSPSKLMALDLLQINIHEDEATNTFQVSAMVLSGSKLAHPSHLA